MDNIQMGAVITAILGLVGLLKALQYLYEVVFTKPRKEVEAQIMTLKSEIEERQKELSLRVKEVEEHKILSNARHEHAQRVIEKLEIKMDDIVDRVEDMQKNLNDKFQLIVDLIKQKKEW